jgi:O-antigen/teichoic acid export membrane protein
MPGARVPGPDGLRARVLNGLAWKFVSQLVLQGSRVVVAVVLARLLAPHDYGLAGMALVFATLVLVFSDLALGAALVQRRELSEADRSTVFWTGLGAGLAFTLIGVAISGPVADFYGQPEVQPLFAALSLSFVVTSLGTTQSALLTRELRFRSLELRMMAGTLAGAVVGIVAAARGYGAWAVIAQQLTLATVSTLLLWLVCPWRPRLTFSRASLRDLGGFSGNVFGQRLLYYLHLNADKVLIGRVLGPAALGAYSLAYNIMLVPFSRISVPIAEVLFPAFSRLQDQPQRMASAWIRASRFVGAISIPALAGLIGVAPDFVRVVLGEAWAPATPVLQILAWVGLLQSLQTLNGNILQALDRTGTLLRYSVVFFAANVAAFVLGLRWGIVGVAACYAVSSTLVEPIYTWVTARALGISPWSFPRAFSGVVQAALAMLACVLLARYALIEAGIGAGGRLPLLVLLGAAVYLPCCAWREPEMLAEVRRLTGARRRRRAAEGTPALSTLK